QCLTLNKNERYQCKRRAPFPVSDVDIVHSDGSWQVKHCYEYVNGWMLAISVNLRCNNDCKLLTNGVDTKNISFYATKKQGRNFNMSAVMVKAYRSYLKHVSNETYVQGLRDQQRLLLFRVTHAINQQQELSAPMVISYIMGWGDTIRSHHYSPIYWLSFLHVLFEKRCVTGTGEQ
ncbi:hypothetical protein OG21DRAFT_1428272, partial [Imleria badia]